MLSRCPARSSYCRPFWHSQTSSPKPLAHRQHCRLDGPHQRQIRCEWVRSDSNWTDSISGVGLKDPFALQQCFRIHSSAVNTILCALPLATFLRVLND